MYRNVLIAIDLNDKSSWVKALPTAVNMCKSFGANLHLLTVVPEFGMSVVGQFFPKGFEKKCFMPSSNLKIKTSLTI